MVGENPLQVIPAISSGSYVNTNKKGRPRKGHGSIIFSQQPQAMVAKLIELNEVKADCNIPAEKHEIYECKKPLSSVCELEKNTVQNDVIVYQTNNKMEHNVLAVTTASACISHYENSNRKGRPRKDNIIRFGPQPQSMVSKFLSNIKTECKTAENGHYDIETISIPSTPLCKSEEDQTKDDDDDYFEKSKRKKISKKLKEPAKPRIYSCDFENCSYSTKLASNLIRHKRVHTGEKPYLCDQCSFRSNFINSLKCHKRLHTEVRPYKCPECSYSCNSTSNLKKHCYARHKTIEIYVKV